MGDALCIPYFSIWPSTILDCLVCVGGQVAVNRVDDFLASVSVVLAGVGTLSIKIVVDIANRVVMAEIMLWSS